MNVIDFFLLFTGTESWPKLYKRGHKQVANILWYEENLYAHLPLGYVENMTEFYFSNNNRVQHVQKVRFPPRLYYPIRQANDAAFLDGNAVLSQISQQMEQPRDEMLTEETKRENYYYPKKRIKIRRVRRSNI